VRIAFALLTGLLIVGCQAAPRTEGPVASSPVLPAVLVHLPGVAGPMAIDATLVSGLIDGGVADEAETFDWNAGRRGFPALNGYDENRREAGRLAARLTELFRADPRRRITVSGHSGGTAVAVWALEQLPADVRIDRLVLLASALSPAYDLSPALTHVREEAVSFYSPFDREVLGLGTKLLGTMDRQYTPAAGYAGFTPPPGAAGAYAKLKQVAYDAEWKRYGHYGDHIGMMESAFAASVIAPLVVPAARPPGGHR
jgi:pimeloyl-ACP methyl ester carboxylesterase